MCCSPWVLKELDMTEQLNCTEINELMIYMISYNDIYDNQSKKNRMHSFFNSVPSYSNATSLYFTLIRSLNYYTRIFEIMCLILLVI